MSFEFWKVIFDWLAVLLLGLTFIAGLGALVTGKVVADRQTKKFRTDLDAAKGRTAALQNRMLDVFGPRGLTVEQSNRIVKGLAGLKGVKIDVYVVDPGNAFTSSNDSTSLGHEFVRTLRAAGMDAEGWLMTSCPGVQVVDISVITLPDSPKFHIAERVRDAFRAEIGMFSGIADAIPYCTSVLPLDKNDVHKHWAGANKNTIGIAIGAKIQPILTREMLEPPYEQNKP